MHPAPFFVLTYLAVALQSGLAPHLRVGGAVPNLTLIAAVFIAINASREAGLIGCFLIGLTHDIISVDTLGLYALSYGLFALIAAGTAQSVQRGHPLTHAAMTLLGGAITAVIIFIHGVVPYFRGVPIGFWPLMGSALYSALLAPIVIGALHQFGALFSFQPTRRRMR